jgi:PAS domain S-box-containing protein
MAGEGPERGSGGTPTDAAGGSPGPTDLSRRLIEYSSDLISVLEPDGEIRFVSPSVTDILGYEQAALEGENALELLHPEDRERIGERFEALLEQPGATDEVEYRYRTAGGDWVWLETRGQNRLDDDVLDGVVTVSRDVTERIQRERALETLHDRTREMLTAETRAEIAEVTADSASEVLGFPVAVVRVLSSDGQRLEPVAVTNRAGDVLGERPTYQVGEGTAGAAFEAGEPAVYNDLQHVDDGYDRGDAKSGLFVPIGEHGVLGIGHTEAGALDDADVQLGRILAANAEVAFDRLERERELERQNERLEEFASVISHDLRSPLNVATGRLDLLDADPEQVEPIRDALARMEELIENVLALARKGQTVDETQPVRLSEIAQECWRTVSTREATIEVESDCTFEADPARLPEIFENLFRNAAEHGTAEDREDSVTIRVGALPNGFYVADDGPGIPRSQRDRVFDSGFSTTQAGTGFGLSIVKQIAEAHGWTVTLADADDGATFEFTNVTIVPEEP